MTIRLARRENGNLVPWFRAGNAQLDWALSELRVRKAVWGDAEASPEDALLFQRAMNDWTEWECCIILAEVGSDGRIRVEPGELHYSSISGLRRYALSPDSS